MIDKPDVYPKSGLDCWAGVCCSASFPARFSPTHCI